MRTVDPLEGRLISGSGRGRETLCKGAREPRPIGVISGAGAGKANGGSVGWEVGRGFIPGSGPGPTERSWNWREGAKMGGKTHKCHEWGWSKEG